MSPVSQGVVNAAFNQAVKRHAEGDLGKAMNILQFLTILAPTDAGVWFALARCHDDAGEPEVAERLRWLGRSLAEAGAGP
ncbi:MAG TPA: tetratricopeptide repeat protein [Polyangiaceae bacterium]|nr:tetratricopeptide repeat protein [Polyangiaceae bacterium]